MTTTATSTTPTTSQFTTSVIVYYPYHQLPSQPVLPSPQPFLPKKTYFPHHTSKNHHYTNPNPANTPTTPPSHPHHSSKNPHFINHHYISHFSRTKSCQHHHHTFTTPPLIPQEWSDQEEWSIHCLPWCPPKLVSALELLLLTLWAFSGRFGGYRWIDEI